MDFHTLTRKQLQTLCKKNKIPANLTNVAMADALSALPMVDGIDDISPAAKSLAGGGASTNRATATTTRRNTRQTPAKTMGATLDFSRIGVDENSNLYHNTTPAPPPPAASVVPGSRNLKGGETTLTRAQGTRRSTRLASKNAPGKNTNSGDDLQITETLAKKMDFAEIPKEPHSCPAYDVDLVTESLRGIDLDEKSVEGLENSINEVKDSNCSAEKQNQSEVSFHEDGSQVESKTKVVVEGAGAEICDNESKIDATRTDNDCEIGKELDSNVVAAEDEQTDDDPFCVENGTNLNICKEVEVVESKQEAVDHISETETNEEDDNEKEVEFSEFAASESVDEEKDTSLEDMDDVVVGVAEPDESGDSGLEYKTEEEEQYVVGDIITEPPAIITEPMVKISSATGEEEDAIAEDNLAERLDALKLIGDSGVNDNSTAAVASLPEQELNIEECHSSKQKLGSIAAAESNENMSGSEKIVSELCTGSISDLMSSPVKKVVAAAASPSPMKKTPLWVQKSSVSKTPSIGGNSTGRRRTTAAKVVSTDDKENNNNMMMIIIDSAAAKDDNEKKDGCFMMMEETEKKKKKAWDQGTSLTKLKKELKAALEKTNNNNKGKGTSNRAALQALTENIQ